MADKTKEKTKEKADGKEGKASSAEGKIGIVSLAHYGRGHPGLVRFRFCAGTIDCRFNDFDAGR